MIKIIMLIIIILIPISALYVYLINENKSTDPYLLIIHLILCIVGYKLLTIYTK